MPKTHLESYLEYYLSLESPGFAVLVKGPWGTGKTFQVKKFIPEAKRYYVSLFGVDSIEQLHTEVYAAAFPMQEKAEKIAHVTCEMAEKLGVFSELIKYAPSLITSIFRRNLKNDRTLIFDDLERSGLAPKDLFGAINFYIEQKQFKVIVIAHDEKIEQNFFEMKEKIFGNQIEVEPMVDEAFDYFIDSIKDENQKKFITKHKSIIMDVFCQSKEKSLRILKHTVEDIVRAYKIIDTQHTSNEEAMRHFVSIFSVFDIETRNNNLCKDDIITRTEHYLDLYMEGSEISALKKIASKYPTIDIFDKMLSDNFLKSFFIDGFYDKSILNASLNNSIFFLKEEDAPAWKYVIQFDSLESKVVEKKLRKMLDQFMKREIVDCGEMLHIFALLLMMSENNISTKSLDDVKNDCNKYIEDVLNDHRLPPQNPNDHWFTEYHFSYDGIGYWVSETTRPIFNEIFQNIKDARKQAFNQTLPTIANDLLELVKDVPEALVDKISLTRRGESMYADIPVLKLIDPNLFVTNWLSLQHKDWKHIKYALENRYDNQKLHSDLQDEVLWAKELYKSLIAAANAKTGFDALRIRRIIPVIFDKEFGKTTDITNE
ncbi:P-loop NTPase fold protein [Desulfovibrio desulfuricans]|uniref:P-loop NTPase fold protein n=2 Tax=Bacteria TaxID=2 RepID=UPI001C00B9EF|nr:P-loop NTPase fold protein [Desulfovibrio desulfuricans]MBT9747590.1 hypothetical protein [Desulfovibrio desulfuricans]